MSTINIQVAERAGARLVIGLSGTSGSGKTLTALLLAYGMVDGDGSKVGLLCTENRRGRCTPAVTPTKRYATSWE
jgi:pantothenate kinase-related protein Tda10